MWNNVGFLVGETFNSPNIEQSNSKFEKYIKSYYNDTKPPYHTSIDVYGNKCFNLLSGVVYAISQGQDRFTVNIRISSNLLLRYGNLTDIYVWEGNGVNTGQLIGLADKYVTFEYCTNHESKHTVRIKGDRYFKQNPYEYLIKDNPPEVINYSYDYYQYKFGETNG